MKRLVCGSGSLGRWQPLNLFTSNVPNGRRLSGVAAALLLASIFGQTSLSQDAAWACEPSRLGLVKRASSLMGRKVIDRNDHVIGRLEDLLLDISNGDVPVTLLSAGTKAQLTPVPAGTFRFVSVTELVVGTEKKTFQNAPQISRSAVSKGLTADQLKHTFVYFSRKTQHSAAVSNRFCTASALLGVPVLDQNNEIVGRLREIMVDLTRGYIVYLVVQPTQNPGGPADLYPIPPVSVSLADNARALLLKTERNHFLSGPHFSNEFWTDLAFPQMLAAIQNHYGLPHVGGLGNEASAAAFGGSDSNERADSEITQAVLEEIVQARNGFVNLDIVVTTASGQVTLTGTVKDENQKQKLIAVVERVAGPGKVEDHLETRPRARTARL
jgi:sporulation protein YlmC with PRC-barrel domain